MNRDMTQQQADQLARYLASLRPGQQAWTIRAVTDALTDAATKHTRDVQTLTTAALRATLDPTVKTPAVIAMTGRHWETPSTPQETTPLRVRRYCPRCSWFHHDTEPCETPATVNPTAHAEAARAALKPTRRYDAE